MSYHHFKFEEVPGFFGDYVDLAENSSESKVATQPGFALVDRQYDSAANLVVEAKPWERFINYVRGLNNSCPEDVSYKVLFLTRHGLGYHNVVIAREGSKAWRVSDVHLCLALITTA
jgi:hypothetical protein